MVGQRLKKRPVLYLDVLSVLYLGLSPVFSRFSAKISLAFLTFLCHTPSRSSATNRQKNQTPREQGTESHGSFKRHGLGNKKHLKTAELPREAGKLSRVALGFCVHGRGIDKEVTINHTTNRVNKQSTTCNSN